MTPPAATGTPGPGGRRLPAAFRALAHRNFRLYFIGQGISILGSWLQQVALSWLVYRLTGSVALLGVTAFLSMIPQLVVGPLAGAWIDRHDKRRLLIFVELGLALQGLALAGLTWTGMIGAELIVAMSLLLGLLNAIETPLRQSLLNSLVAGRREDLTNAIALNAMLYNIGRFVGPPIAGLLIGLTGEAFCFGLNAVSFLALVFALKALQVESTARASGSVAAVFREGLRHALDSYPIRVLLILLAVSNFTVSCYAVLLPVMAKKVFLGDATTLGWLWGAAGCGSLFSTLVLANRKSLPSTGNAVLAGALISAVALLVVAASTWFAMTVVAMAVLGFGMVVTNVGCNTILQTIAPEHLRGRIVSFFTSIRFGLDALGGLVAGLAAERLGASTTFAIEGIVLGVAVTALLAMRRRLVDALKA
ncbi:MAG: MFS transporter [Rhodocyclales bacterium]|jgi:MFS family permease|nr:MFS transporter [Rhodocyclales bacterium]